MRSHRHSIILAAGLAGALALGGVGCSFSSSHESTSSVSTSVTDENGVTETHESTTTETDGVTETTESDSLTIDIEDWTDAWIGEAEGGQTIFYAESPDGGKQGLFAVYDPSDSSVEGVVGDNHTDEEGDAVQTVDVYSGDSVTMVIRDRGDDGSITINVGDPYGDARLDPVSMDEFIERLSAVDVNGDVLTH